MTHLPRPQSGLFHAGPRASLSTNDEMDGRLLSGGSHTVVGNPRALVLILLWHMDDEVKWGRDGTAD